MKLKHGDKVMVIAGKDAGKESRITRVINDKGKVLVEGVNTAKRHRRPTGSTMQGWPSPSPSARASTPACCGTSWRARRPGAPSPAGAPSC